MTSGIYQIRNTINDKKYIGSTNDWDRRRDQHLQALRRNKHQNPKLQAAWNKYSEDVFAFELVETVPENDLFVTEQSYIDKNIGGYNVNPIAANPPSHKDRKRSEETKRKMSAAQKGTEFTEDHKVKLRQAAQERIKLNPATCPPSRLGLVHSEDTKRKMSEVKTGKKFSLDHRQNISKSRTGRKHTEEAKQKMRESYMRRHPNQSFNP